MTGFIKSMIWQHAHNNAVMGIYNRNQKAAHARTHADMVGMKRRNETN